MARWESPSAVDEISLAGGPLTPYTASAGMVEAQVYLRQPDPAIASKYLDATSRYLRMYNELVGPYPYKKFALVENFWETGYGMPSYTLLGPQIIRFPFILTSSYPTRSCTTGGATRCTWTTPRATGARASPPTSPIT